MICYLKLFEIDLLVLINLLNKKYIKHQGINCQIDRFASSMQNGVFSTLGEVNQYYVNRHID